MDGIGRAFSKLMSALRGAAGATDALNELLMKLLHTASLILLMQAILKLHQ